MLQKFYFKQFSLAEVHSLNVNWLIILVSRVFTNGPGHLGSTEKIVN